MLLYQSKNFTFNRIQAIVFNEKEGFWYCWFVADLKNDDPIFNESVPKEGGS